MKLYLLDLGYMEIDSNKVVYGSVQVSVSNPNPPCQFRAIPMEAALIVTDDGHKILYDTGANFEGMNGYWPESVCQRSPFTFTEDQRIENQLAKCGYTIDDIDTVIISHMHIDHIGNLELFPHVKAYVDRKEFEYALYMAHSYSDPLKQPGGYLVAMKNEINAPVEEYIMVDEDTEIFPGVELIQVPGHSVGVLAVKLTLENEGTVILTSDACYTAENFGPPVKYSNVPYDSVAYRNSMEKLRRLQKKYNAKLIFGHDIDQFRALKKAPEYFD